MKTLKPPFSRYAVTEDGEVYSLIKKEPFKMKTFFDKDGYLRVTLNTDDQIKKQVIVPRIMYEAFYTSIPVDNVIRHVDGDTNNNHITNLDIGTVLENNRDKQRHGTQCSEENHGRNILTKEQAIHIKYSTTCGAELGRKFGVNKETIYAIRKGRTWKDV